MRCLRRSCLRPRWALRVRSLAQTQPPTSATAAATAASPGESKTATGCVAAAVDGRTFTFTESVTPASPSADRDPSVAAPPIPATSWTLVARSDIDLTKYVGKKVELTGTPDAKGGMSGYNSESTHAFAQRHDWPTLPREVGEGVGGNVLLTQTGDQEVRSRTGDQAIGRSPESPVTLLISDSCEELVNLQ